MRTGLQDVTNALELPPSSSRKRSRQDVEEQDACLLPQPLKPTVQTTKSDTIAPLEHSRLSSGQHQRGGAHRQMRQGRLGLSLPTITPGKIFSFHKS